MEESSTYQLIISRGRVQGVRNMVLRQGRLRLWEPGPAQLARIESIDDLERLQQLGDRLFSVSTWSEILAVP